MNLKLRYIVMFGFIGRLFQSCTSFLGGYVIESGKVYWEGGLAYGNRLELNDVDVSTFKEMTSSYGHDKNNVFYRNKKLPSASPKYFEILKVNYAKDLDRCYYENRLLSQADPATFLCVTEREISGVEITYAKDKYSVYFDGHKVSEEPDKFVCLSSQYKLFKDSKNVYFMNRIVDEMDANTFELIRFEKFERSKNYSIPYAKDKYSVWYLNTTYLEKISVADPKKFKLLSKSNSDIILAIDDRNVYLEDQVLQNVDLSSFEAFGNIHRDKYNYYLPIQNRSGEMHLVKIFRAANPDSLMLFQFMEKVKVATIEIEKFAYQVAQRHSLWGGLLPQISIYPKAIDNDVSKGIELDNKEFLIRNVNSIMLKIQVDVVSVNDIAKATKYFVNLLNDQALFKRIPPKNILLRITMSTNDSINICEFKVNDNTLDKNMEVTEQNIEVKVIKQIDLHSDRIKIYD